MNVPENLKYTESHEWVLLDGDIATVGITDHAQAELTDIVFAEPPKIVKPGDAPSDTPEREDRVRRTTFPPTDQPPVVVDRQQ